MSKSTYSRKKEEVVVVKSRTSYCSAYQAEVPVYGQHEKREFSNGQ